MPIFVGGPLDKGHQMTKYVQCETTHSHTCRHILTRSLPCHFDVQIVCLHKYVTKGKEEKGRGKSRWVREEGKGEGREGGRALPPTVSSHNAYGYKGYADIRWGSAG